MSQGALFSMSPVRALRGRTKRTLVKGETTVRTPFPSATTFVERIFLVGEFPVDKVSDFPCVAENVPAQSRIMRQRHPNCVTRVSNVLYKTGWENVVAFKGGFDVPK